MDRIVLAAGLVLLAGCGREAGPLSVPVQRVASDGRDPGELGAYIDMGDPFAAEYIVKDISPEKSQWRWAFANPELKVRTPEWKPLKFSMSFAVPAVTFRVTGPIEVSCFLDGKSLGALRVTEPGKQTYLRPVPDGWFAPGQAVTVTAQADKKFIAKEDGAQLSFLFGGAGFVQK